MKTEKNSGSLETHGVNIGEKWDILEWPCMVTNSELNKVEPGLPPELGLNITILVMKMELTVPKKLNMLTPVLNSLPNSDLFFHF